jgi:predicted Zn-dependent protease
MATSLTGQTNDSSSLLTTANSPDRRVQQALARIRQLQQRTQDALDQGELQHEDEQVSWA